MFFLLERGDVFGEVTNPVAVLQFPFVSRMDKRMSVTIISIVANFIFSSYWMDYIDVYIGASFMMGLYIFILETFLLFW